MPAATWRPPGWRRSLQLVLGLLWLLDGLLQLQAGMFRPGAQGLGGILAGAAAGNPGPVARSITWNAHLVDHHAVAANAAFALLQILIGLGIAWRPAVKPALAVSVVWTLAVWWLGEGLGGVLHGTGTTLAGGPGAVLFYGLLAVLLWPSRDDRALPFAAAGAVGARAARVAWAATWLVLAVLCLLGSGRAPGELRQVVTAVDAGEPGWLHALDRHVASAGGADGLAVAVAVAVVCVVVATGVYLPAPANRAVLVTAVVVAVALWIFTQNFGMILAGGATDPDSGPLLALLALAYWPLRPAAATTAVPAAAGPALDMA